MKYENTFKAIDQILWKEQVCGSELDYRNTVCLTLSNPEFFKVHETLQIANGSIYKLCLVPVNL